VSNFITIDRGYGPQLVSVYSCAWLSSDAIATPV